MDTHVKFDDLFAAFEWVSAAPLGENEAFVGRETGSTHWSSSFNDVDEELPDDIDDATRYLPLPHKNELDLGHSLVMRFVREQLPDAYGLVDGYFHRKGAYGRFKELLARKGRLDAWHEYEAKATEQALREWAEENGLRVDP
jgi:hypothetical protein